MKEEKAKISIKKILVALTSLIMLVGFVFLFMSASDSKEDKTCKGLVISFYNKNAGAYADTAFIRQQIRKDSMLNPEGKLLNKIDISAIEDRVLRQDWVKEADVYLGNNDYLHVKINQLKPIARVFTTQGKSYYLDMDNKKIEANGRFSVRLPVFTSFPEGKEQGDSLLLTQMRDLSVFIGNEELWMAQIDQILINGKKEFELVPHVGEARILLGGADRLEEKFDKLLTFYKEGLQKVGWGYYKTIDLRFKDQVVAKRRGEETSPVIDSLAHRNIPEPDQINRQIATN